MLTKLRYSSIIVLLSSLLLFVPFVPSQTDPPPAPKPEATPPRAKDGRKLFTAMDLLSIQGVGGPRISPDGSMLAYTVTETKTDKDKEWKSTTHIWVVSVRGGAPRQFTRGDSSCTSPEWTPDGKMIAFLTDREKAGERQVWMMYSDGGEAWPVTSHKGGVISFRISPDGKGVLFTATDQPTKEEEERKRLKDDTILIDQDLKMTHLWHFDIEKKEAKRLTEGSFTVSEPHWSPDGTHATFTARPTPKADDGGFAEAWVINVATKEKKKVEDTPGSSDNVRWSPDGKWLAYTGTRRMGDGVATTFLYVVSSAGGTPREVSTNFDNNVGPPFWSRDGKSVYFSANIFQSVEAFSINVMNGSFAQLTRGGGTLAIADISRDGATIVGTLSTAARPAEIFVANADFKSIRTVTDHNSWLRDFAIAETEIIRWKSTDGMEIEGILTKPVGYVGGKVPLLLNPHGGPTAASLNNFNGLVQVLAANGFSVLQPNFRGSTGRGLAFAQANKNTWGKGDYEDCMTGVDHLIAKGLADPDKLGALGWSYGGYMTFWILTQTDRFKAVSPGAGLSNIYSMYSQNDIQRYLRWFYDDKSPWDATELYWDRSPMKYVKNVKTPTMIMHGQNDVRVPIAQAQEFYMALKEMNVPVEFVVYPRAGHGITEPRHVVDRVRRYVRFFSKYLDVPVITEPAVK